MTSVNDRLARLSISVQKDRVQRSLASGWFFRLWVRR